MTLAFPVLHTFSMSNLYANIKEAFTASDGLSIILAVGNTLRSDDGVGPFVASQLDSNDKLKVIDAGSNPENVINEIVKLKPKNIIIVDAADFGSEPGTVKMVDKENIPEITLSTHIIPLGVIASILAQDTKAKISFLGIQAKSLKLGGKMCEEVRLAASEVIGEIRRKFYNA